MDVTTFAVNQFIPHPMMLFAAGTYSENESPHLALVSWVNFYWDDGLGVVLCMDGDKTVKRNFEREGVMVLNALGVVGPGKVHAQYKYAYHTGKQKELLRKAAPLQPNPLSWTDHHPIVAIRSSRCALATVAKSQ